MNTITSLATGTVVAAAVLASQAVGATHVANNETMPDVTTSTRHCLDASSKHSYIVTLARGTAQISLADGKPLCSEGAVTVANYQLPATWNKDGFNETAIPQTVIDQKSMKVPANNGEWTATVNLSTGDDCLASQMDTFVGGTPVGNIVNLHDFEDREIIGKIFAAVDEECKPAEETKMIEVCDLTTKKVVKIDEKDFDSSKYSKDLKKCEQGHVNGDETETPKPTPTPTPTPTPVTPAPKPQGGQGSGQVLGTTTKPAVIAATGSAELGTVLSAVVLGAVTYAGALMRRS